MADRSLRDDPAGRSPPEVPGLLGEGPPVEVTESVGRVVMNHNSDSLRNLRLYSSSDSESCPIDDVDLSIRRDWRVGSSESSDIEFFECDEGSRGKSSGKGRTHCCNPLGEDLSMLPLPDLSKLQIDCDKEEEFLMIGEVRSIIGDIVTVHALPDTPAYDLDTILFVERDSKRAPMGAIVDVIGPVTSPIYCVRIDSTEGHGLGAGMKVYSAPKSDFTLYVFVKELMKIKGSDASWLNDREMPPEAAEGDSSEDEEPRQVQRKRGRNSPERHRNFERNMNRWNTLNTRATRLADNIRDYNAACSAQGFIGARSPRSFQPIRPTFTQCPRPFTPFLRTFGPQPPFLPPQGNGNRYPGPSRPL